MAPWPATTKSVKLWPRRRSRPHVPSKRRSRRPSECAVARRRLQRQASEPRRRGFGKRGLVELCCRARHVRQYLRRPSFGHPKLWGVRDRVRDGSSLPSGLLHVPERAHGVRGDLHGHVVRSRELWELRKHVHRWPRLFRERVRDRLRGHTHAMWSGVRGHEHGRRPLRWLQRRVPVGSRVLRRRLRLPGCGTAGLRRTVRRRELEPHELRAMWNSMRRRPKLPRRRLHGRRSGRRGRRGRDRWQRRQYDGWFGRRHRWAAGGIARRGREHRFVRNARLRSSVCPRDARRRSRHDRRLGVRRVLVHLADEPDRDA